MQVASKTPLWNEGRRGTVVELRMTSLTGTSITLGIGFRDRNTPVDVDWGDGTVGRYAKPASGDFYVTHDYPRYGTYRARFYDANSVGFRFLDGQPLHPYDAALVSVVDYGETLRCVQSAAYMSCANLRRFVAPEASWVGERSFADCKALEHVEIGDSGWHYDGSYENCTSLVSFAARGCGICWNYVWLGCSRLRELRLGTVKQLAARVFEGCSNLTDVWIDGKTVDQIRQVARYGNIASGYGAKFPWGAHEGIRFHGTDGTVLADGTVIN